MLCVKVKVQGVVQGVGFRPFVYALALELDLKGYVNNDEKGVNILLQGSKKNIEFFLEKLQKNPPPISKIDTVLVDEVTLQKEYKTFEIKQSETSSLKTTNVSPDIAICKDCLEDIKDPKNRRYRYALTNCTNCGPRYSIIKTVPYDRVNTSMSEFKMCDDCYAEYTNPLDRRYHAQPICCDVCKPQISLWDKQDELTCGDIYEKTASLIKEGHILAIKGIGGFHIVCDSVSDEVVKKLRMYKNRPTKPLAIMCKDISQIKQISHVGIKEEKLLTSKEAPIVILKKADFKTISEFVAPHIDRIGCFLPYTALHHLLFEYLDNPIVATSANLADEPIIRKKEDIFQKLPFIEYVLDFNREIVNAIDDSLLQVVDDKEQILRLARGYAPKVIKLPFESKKNLLAVGANSKNAIALCFNDKIILSAHIGDLNSFKAFDYFERTVETFKRFYEFEPEMIVCDKHPNYETTKWAKQQYNELLEVGHHLAHIYACKAEFGLCEEYLGFSFDGTGYGDDGTLWGGEIFVGDSRKYSFKPIKLLGGSKAIKEPRRVGLSMLFDRYSLDELLKLDLDTLKAFSHVEIKLLYQSYEKNLNAPISSSVGRLFDGVASLSGVVQKISYEGESGLLCESFYDENIKDSFNYFINDGIIDINLVEQIIDKNLSKTQINSMFINTLADIIVDISKLENMEVILSGGVFQNKTLLNLALKRLKDENILSYAQQQTPINDGSIALGQIYYALLKQN